MWLWLSSFLYVAWIRICPIILPVKLIYLSDAVYMH